MNSSEAAEAAPLQNPETRRVQPVIWITALALLFRGILLLFPHLQAPLLGTFRSYNNEMTCVALAMVTGHGFASPYCVPSGPTAWVGPIYPAIIAVAFKLFGVTRAWLFSMLWFNCICSALTCIPIYKIAEKVAGARVAMWSAVLWAVEPYFSRWAVNWIWETVFTTFLLSLLVWWSMSLRRESRLRSWAGWGVLWGVVALVSAAACAVMPPLAAYALRKPKEKVSWLKPLGVFVLAFVCTVAPWSIRNLRVFGTPSLRTNFWVDFWLGNSPMKSGFDDFWKDPSLDVRQRQEYIQLGESAYAKQKKEIALAWVRSDPAGFLETTGKRIVYFWYGIPIMYMYHPEMWRPQNFAFPLFSLTGLLGMFWALHRRNWQALPSAFAIIFYPLVFYIAFAGPRYRNMVEPYLLIFTVYLLSEAQWRRGKQAAPPKAAD